MELLSSAFANGDWIPRIHTVEGANLSPPLHWRHPPAGTRSFVLILDDPDAPPGHWIHWVLYDIPANCSELPQGVKPIDELPNGARHGCCWGVEHFSRRGYQGPQPPPGPPHRYRFQLSALDTRLNLAAGASAAAVRSAMAGHLLEQAELTGLDQHPALSTHRRH